MILAAAVCATHECLYGTSKRRTEARGHGVELLDR